MGLIVISKVLKYKAFIFAVILVLSLAFFQSNQSLNESSEAPISNSSSSRSVDTPETPSIPETPDLPDGNDNNSKGTSKTSISISLRTSTNNLASIKGDSKTNDTTIEVIEREIESGSIKLSFSSNGGDFKIKEKIEDDEGKTSVKFSSKSSQSTKSENSSEISIDLED